MDSRGKGQKPAQNELRKSSSIAAKLAQTLPQEKPKAAALSSVSNQAINKEKSRNLNQSNLATDKDKPRANGHKEGATAAARALTGVNGKEISPVMSTVTTKIANGCLLILSPLCFVCHFDFIKKFFLFLVLLLTPSLGCNFFASFIHMDLGYK